MKKYMKKPVVVTAIQYTGVNIEEISEWLGDKLVSEAREGIGCVGYWVTTLEGNKMLSINDFILKGVYGEVSLCKADIFEKTYLIFSGEPTGSELIALERAEQLAKHSRTPQKDSEENKRLQLAHAAAFLVSYVKRLDIKDTDISEHRPLHWNIDVWVHMCTKPYLDRLVIAGALIAAEIDRVQLMKE